MKVPAMSPRVRKLALTAHITFSVGWIGAVASFLVLSIAGVTSKDAEVVRGSYFAMNFIGLFIIVPMSLAALATGVVQSLGTEWGLLRHYWVLVKFLLTIGATLLLLMHQFTAVAEAARLVSHVTPGTLPEVGRLGPKLVGDAGLALLALLVITALSVFKPWGRTRYGQSKQQQERREGANLMGLSPITKAKQYESPQAVKSLPLGLKIFLAVISIIVALFAVLHLSGVHHH